ncbi:TIR-like protein FxsC [Streptomyces sp. NPDC046909]|uniref:TIR-like protein FxsC n=1 Tax=Streptomyces sp. NPDC046909 TaxID=3155617 RepID=UPI0033CC224D
MESSESLGAGAAVPYFFLSYAHIPPDGSFDDPDPNLWVRRLFRDLCSHIRNITNVPVGGAGFMDGSMQAGQIWPEELTRSIARCKVFVPLYSPRYFNSAWCGKEWALFDRRRVRVDGQGDHGGTPIAMVPALWSPISDRELPECAKGIQYAHPDLGARYRSFGLYGLIKVKAFRTDYERAVLQLAYRIKEVAESVSVEHGIAADLANARDAFAPPATTHSSTGRTLRISVAAGSTGRLPQGSSPECYGPSPLDWNPYHADPDQPLAKTAEAIAARLDYRPVVQEFDPAFGPADAPEILLLDRWMLRDSEQLEQLRAFDSDNTRSTGLAVPWNEADDDNKGVRQKLVDDVEAALPNTTRRQRPALKSTALGIPDHRTFDDVLPKVVAWASREYLRNAPPCPPPGTGPERFRVGEAGGHAGRPMEHRRNAEEGNRDEQP